LPVKEFLGKTAVVTGAGSGLGRCMAERFAAEGMQLVLADIELEPLMQFEETLRKRGLQTIAEQVDVSQAADLERLAERAYAQFGAVHLLCNNAGVFPPGAPVWREEPATWQWTLGVNFFGVLHGIQAFVPRMLRAGHEAHIVNTASLAGLTTRPLMSAYNVSKHAVVALSECLHAELQLTSDKIHVSVLCPAWAKTRLAESTRNKPPGVHANPDSSFGFSEALRDVVEGGTEPEVIVNTMLEAIRANRFWILTHPHLNQGIRDRFESILAGTNPPVKDLRKSPTPLA
jgi:NAD(P)-dependent dehydrogenase (short-subunit alcohol dehydrogenase family)